MNFSTNETLSNHGRLVGSIVREPVKTHEVLGENFYELLLQVKRLSETVDILPVTFGERLIADMSILKQGQEIAVEGEYRSINKIVGERSKLILYFFAKDISNSQNVTSNEDMNYLKLRGYICKPPILRETPFHKHICDVLVAVNRASNNKSDYIPCIAWGRNAKFMGSLNVGTKIELEGRIQSRGYKKTLEDGRQEERTAYEVSCKNFSVVENNSQTTNIQITDQTEIG